MDCLLAFYAIHHAAEVAKATGETYHGLLSRLGLGWRFGHLRSAGGDQEIDLVAELPDGSVLAFESKLSQTVSAADARHLAALRDRLGESFRAGLVVNPGATAFRLGDRIAAVPLGTLA